MVLNCKIDDCEQTPLTKGLCGRHYQNYRKHGKPDGKYIRVKKGATIEERLKNKSQFNSNTGCIEWIGVTNGTGYGKLEINKKTYSAHIISFELFKGNRESGLQVLHTCDNRKCINPDHLFLGTQSDNMFDMHSKGRHSKRKK